jgi:hypothetical protein
LNLTGSYLLREDQYKYHFRKWKIKKSLKAPLKRKLVEKAQERAAQGKRTAYAVGNRPINGRKLLREVKGKIDIDIALKPVTGGQGGIQPFLGGFALLFGSGM